MRVVIHVEGSCVNMHFLLPNVKRKGRFLLWSTIGRLLRFAGVRRTMLRRGVEGVDVLWEIYESAYDVSIQL